MEHVTNAVACVTPNDGVAQGLDMVGDYVSHLLVHSSWLASLDGLLKAVVSGFN